MNFSVVVSVLAITLAVSLLGVVFILYRTMRRMADINEQLLLLVGMGQQGPDAARALVAKAKGPRRTPPVEAERKPGPIQDGIVMRIGAT